MKNCTEGINSIAEQIVKVGRQLQKNGLLASADGNISYRVDDETILITPSKCPKFLLLDDDIAIVKINGDVVRGQPSSELPMHLSVYRSNPKTVCVIHAHPPHAIAWTLAYPECRNLPVNHFPNEVLDSPTVPIVPYAHPGSEKLAKSVQKYTRSTPGVLLERHGSVVWSDNLWSAYCITERIEHLSKILTCAYTLGKPTPLN